MIHFSLIFIYKRYLMSEERQELALDAVDSVLNIAETDGILHYPCLRDWNNAR